MAAALCVIDGIIRDVQNQTDPIENCKTESNQIEIVKSHILFGCVWTFSNSTSRLGLQYLQIEPNQIKPYYI